MLLIFIIENVSVLGIVTMIYNSPYVVTFHILLSFDSHLTTTVVFFFLYFRVVILYICNVIVLFFFYVGFSQQLVSELWFDLVENRKLKPILDFVIRSENLYL